MMRRVFRSSVFRLLIVATMLSSVLFQSTAFALTSAQLKALNSHVYYVNTEEDTASSCSGAVNGLRGSDAPSQVWNYFKDVGLDDIHTAAVWGNIKDESSFNPQIVQDPPPNNTADPSLIRKGGWGLVQWTPGYKVTDIAKQMGVSGTIGELLTQLNLVWAEMQKETPTGATDFMAGFKATTTLADATTYFQVHFESGDPGRRQQYAQEGLTTYGNGSAASSTASTGAVTADSTAALGGCGGGDFTTNFVEYKQCSYDNKPVAWASTPYGFGHTVCSSGCGPSAMAMIITNLTGQKVTPDMTATYGAANGTVASGGGSNWNIASVIGGHWGLKATGALGKDVTAINKVLQSGGLVLATGVGAAPFTTSGHFIVIRAITSDGKWLTGNSANIDSSTPYDPATLIVNGSAQSPGFNAWGLTK